MRRTSILLLAGYLCLTCAIGMAAQTDNVLRNPQVSNASFAITPPLRELVKNQPTQLHFGYHHASPVLHPKAALLQRFAKGLDYAAIKDSVVQTSNQPATIPVDQL